MPSSLRRDQVAKAARSFLACHWDAPEERRCAHCGGVIAPGQHWEYYRFDPGRPEAERELLHVHCMATLITAAFGLARQRWAEERGEG